MFPKTRLAVALLSLTLALGTQPFAGAQETLKSDNAAKALVAGTFHGKGDQNYVIPAGTDLAKFQTVSIYCQRFNANFGAAPLEKF